MDDPCSVAPSPDVLRGIFERVDVGAFSIEAESGRVVACNEAFARILGHASAAAAVGTTVFGHYQDPKERAETFRRFLADPGARARGVVRFEAKRVRVDTGEPVDVLITVVTVVQDGKLVRLDGLVEDIGERKSAEKAFRHSEERFRILFETSPMPMALTDPAGRITRSNDAMTRFMGRDEADLAGRSLADLLHPDEPARALPVPGQEGGSELESDWRFLGPAGQPVWGHVTWSWLGDVGGVHSGVAIVQDVTERRRMENTLLRVEKLESLGVLAGGIAHDFNNILAAVVGHLSLVGTMPECEGRLREHVQWAEQAALRARDLTKQLITFARGGAPVKEIGSVADVVREAAALCLRGTPVVVDLDAVEDLRGAEFDPGQIGQVCHNLLLNAAQAMPSGGRLRIRVGNHDVPPGTTLPLAAGPYVRVEVRDEGPGIPESALQHMFDPYFSTKAGGTGLGLATAHSIIRRHDGHIEAGNAPEGGAVFVFLLPAAQGVLAAPGKRPSSESAVPTDGVGRVLVMDDEECVRTVARTILERAGYHVVTVADGEAALRVWGRGRDEGSPFHAVVLDLTVRGGLGGVATLDAMKQRDPDVRAIVTSGYSEDPVMARHREHGFSGVVPKPFTASELQAAVLRVLHRSA